MNTESTPLPETSESAASTPADATPVALTRPWITCLAIVACIGIFLGISTSGAPESRETLARFGYLTGDSIWNGEYWVLVTSVFVHTALWHVGFNVYWLWKFGSRLERAVGSLPYLGLFIGAAFVSSSFQLFTSGNCGIGASGVIYAMFGFMWPTRDRYPQFREVIDSNTVQLFVIWLFGCLAATLADVWVVGNAAHFAGLLFGRVVAGAFALSFKPRLMFTGLIAFVICSTIPLFWCPWSVTWLSIKAYDAHRAERYEAALGRYTQIIELDPKNAWAFLNRSYVYQALEQPEAAQADLEKAREIDPKIVPAE